jgi:hypothetical protein
MSGKTLSLLIASILGFGSAPDYQPADFESSCAIRVKSAVYPSDSLEQRGKARVYVTLCTRDGKPIPDQEILLSATCGTFSCKPVDFEDSAGVDTTLGSCNITDKNGKVMVYLVNIPFNNQGGVTAACDYGTMSVHASCTFLITRHTVKGKPKKIGRLAR